MPALARSLVIKLELLCSAAPFVLFRSISVYVAHKQEVICPLLLPWCLNLSYFNQHNYWRQTDENLMSF